jgi:hypothetical protein
MRGVVKVSPRAASLDARNTAGRIHADALHGGQVRDQAAVARAETGHAVAAGADGQGHGVIAREADTADHVGDIGAPYDPAWPPVDHRVVHLARRLVLGAGRIDNLTANSRYKGLDGARFGSTDSLFSGITLHDKSPRIRMIGAQRVRVRRPTAAYGYHLNILI